MNFSTNDQISLSLSVLSQIHENVLKSKINERYTQVQQEARGREHGAELCDSHLSLLLLPPWHRPPSVSETRSPWARATAKSNQLNKTYLIASTPRCSGGEAPLLGRLLCSVRGEKARPIVHPYHVAAAVLFRNPPL